MNQLKSLESLELKRLEVISWLFLILGLIFLVRLCDRQLIRRDTYVAMAQKQYYTEKEQPAKRGKIYIKDKDSQNIIDETKSGLFAVATDLELYNLIVVPRHVENKQLTAEKLALLTGDNEEEIFDKINCDKWYIPEIKKKMEKTLADKIKAEGLAGVYLEAEYSRFYPEKEFLAQVLGFVNYDGDGKYGLEEYYDGVLKGEGGTLKGLKDNNGRVIKLEESNPGKDGSSIVLTIDRSIQYVVEKKLKEGIEKYGAESASAVIMDAKDGSVLAMSSLPSYDPNKFNEFSGDDQSIFLNPTTSLAWEPGSIFKPIVVAAAVEDGKVEPDSKPDEAEGGFKNFVTVDGYDIHNSQDKSFGYETVTQILENSDNVGMVWIANKLGNESLANYLKKFGFGCKTGIDVSGEYAGKVSPTREWKDVNRATISFGQGITTTPLQIVSSYVTIANKGKSIKPHLIERIINPNGEARIMEPVIGEQVISEQTASKTTQMLISVVENGHGKKAAVSGFKVAGKTGTAQIPKDTGGYEEDQHIGSFAGFAPADDPKFVMLVKLNKPKNVEWAESSAAPVFGDIASWLLNSYYKITPSL
jgi:cell division protein FtsI/penicillin-binding protein 2